jgi:hypothetical protein
VRTLVAAACLLALVAAGCGGDDDEDQPAAALAANLTVAVRPSGPDGPTNTHRIRCARLGPKAGTAACQRLAGLTAAQLEPVPANVACTEIYGGPGLARVRGELHGKRVDARFNLTNGCEIERWDRNRVLLDDAPAGG